MMIALIPGIDLGKLKSKLEDHLGRTPEEERITAVDTSGITVLAHLYKFKVLLADVYLGIPEGCCMIVGSIKDIRSILRILGIPINSFDSAMGVISSDDGVISMRGG